MEENVDSIKGIINNEDDSLKNNLNENNIDENQSILINKSPLDQNSDAKKINLDNEVSKKIINEKVLGSSKDNLKKVPQKKEVPIEKKPFKEFVNDHLLPSLIKEFKERGFEVEDINLKNTYRPIAGDKCFVIYCEIKDTCNFWLSFEKDDISSLKSISICKASQNPSIIESFLIDEKRITLKLIISRILQRLNGQKLIGVN